MDDHQHYRNSVHAVLYRLARLLLGMNKKAIDIVLLPPDEVMEEMIRVNRQGQNAADDNILMNTTDRFPHLSLLMGVLSEESSQKAEQALQAIAEKTPPVDIELYSLAEKYDGLRARRGGALDALHESLLEKIAPLLSTDATRETIYEPDQKRIDDRYITYINAFTRDASRAQFDPHITIHSRDITGLRLPFRFTARRLAICRLGDRCTCREILFEKKLSAV